MEIIELGERGADGRLGTARVRVPAGEYFLGDPCYPFSGQDDAWRVLLDTSDIFRHPIAKLDGHKVLGFGTHHGDGCYRDQDAGVYWVDAGLIGLVPVALIPGGGAQTAGITRLDKLGQFVRFESDVEASRSEDGALLVFGPYMIETEYEDGEEEDEDGEEDEG